MIFSQRILIFASALLISGAMALPTPAENCDQAAAAANDDFSVGEFPSLGERDGILEP